MILNGLLGNPLTHGLPREPIYLLDNGVLLLHIFVRALFSIIRLGLITLDVLHELLLLSNLCLVALLQRFDIGLLTSTAAAAASLSEVLLALSTATARPIHRSVHLFVHYVYCFFFFGYVKM